MSGMFTGVRTRRCAWALIGPKARMTAKPKAEGQPDGRGKETGFIIFINRAHGYSAALTS
jgi:hypothetical protein